MQGWQRAASNLCGVDSECINNHTQCFSTKSCAPVANCCLIIKLWWEEIIFHQNESTITPEQKNIWIYPSLDSDLYQRNFDSRWSRLLLRSSVWLPGLDKMDQVMFRWKSLWRLNRGNLAARRNQNHVWHVALLREKCIKQSSQSFRFTMNNTTIWKVFSYFQHNVHVRNLNAPKLQKPGLGANLYYYKNFIWLDISQM